MTVNVFAALMGLALAAIGGYVIEHSDYASFVIALTALGCFVFVWCVAGFIGAKNEVNGILVPYFYAIMFMAAALVLFSVAALAFQDYMRVYLEHHWDTSDMSFFREEFCEPSEIANTKCAAPLVGADAWCSSGCPGTDGCPGGSSDCAAIRSAAIDESEDWMKDHFGYAGIVGACIVPLLLIGAQCTVNLVTVPIIMKSLLDIINYIFMMLGAALALAGLYGHIHSDLEADIDWIAYLYMGCGASTLFVSFFGIAGARLKDRSLLLMYIVVVFVLIVLLLCSGIAGWVFTHSLDNHYDDKTAAEVQDIACQANLYGCCCCDDYDTTTIGSAERCPEWTKSDILDLIDTNLHFMGLASVLASIFMLVGFSGAIVLRRSLQGYQTDSI